MLIMTTIPPSFPEQNNYDSIIDDKNYDPISQPVIDWVLNNTKWRESNPEIANVILKKLIDHGIHHDNEELLQKVTGVFLTINGIPSSNPLSDVFNKMTNIKGYDSNIDVKAAENWSRELVNTKIDINELLKIVSYSPAIQEKFYHILLNTKSVKILFDSPESKKSIKELLCNSQNWSNLMREFNDSNCDFKKMGFDPFLYMVSNWKDSPSDKEMPPELLCRFGLSRLLVFGKWTDMTNIKEAVNLRSRMFMSRRLDAFIKTDNFKFLDDKSKQEFEILIQALKKVENRPIEIKDVIDAALKNQNFLPGDELLDDLINFGNTQHLELVKEFIEYGYPIDIQMIRRALTFQNYALITLLFKHADKNLMRDEASTILRLVGNIGDPEIGKLLVESVPDIASYCSLEQLKESVSNGQEWFVNWILTNKDCTIVLRDKKELLDASLKGYQLSLIHSLCEMTHTEYPQILDLDAKLQDIKGDQKKLEKLLFSYAIFSSHSEIAELVKHYPIFLAIYPEVRDKTSLITHLPYKSHRQDMSSAYQKTEFDKLEDYIQENLGYATRIYDLLNKYSAMMPTMTHAELLDKIMQDRIIEMPDSQDKQKYIQKRVNHKEQKNTD